MRYACYFIPVIVLSMTPQGILAQNDEKKNPVLEKIFADWKERQGLVKTARYVIAGTTEFKDKDLPAGNPVRPQQTILLLDLEKKRWRLESSQPLINNNAGRGASFDVRVGTAAFDGVALQTYYHRKENGIEAEGPDLSISKGQFNRGGPTSPPLYPVFFAHGIVITAFDTTLRVHDLPTTYDGENFEVRGRLSFQGRNCTVLRTIAIPNAQPYFDELWIDMNQKSTIQRYLVFSGSEPVHRIDVQWKRNDVGIWPEQWTHTWTLAQKVRRIHRLHIESFESNPVIPESAFKLEAKPGMKVIVADSPPPGPEMKTEFPPSRTYLISPSGSWEEIDAKGYTTLEGKRLPPDRQQGWIWWAIVGAVTMIVSAFLYFVWFRSATLPTQKANNA